MIKLVIFDFDDTITDNTKLDFESFKFTCKKFGIKNTISEKKLIFLRKKSYTAKEILGYIKKSNSKKFSENNFLEERTKFLTNDASNDYLQLKSDTKLILKTLNKRKIPVILCTVRKKKKLVLNFLKIHDIRNYFSTILCLSDIKVNIDNQVSENRILIKSSLLKKIIQKFKFKNNEILYIGNSFEDRIASSVFRMTFLKFNNDYLPKENFEYAHYTDSMKNLNKIVGELI